jgi:hypothetical protein
MRRITSVLQGFRGAIDTILGTVFLVAVGSAGWFRENLPNHVAAARAIESGDAEKAHIAMERVLGYTKFKLSARRKAGTQRRWDAADAGSKNSRGGKARVGTKRKVTHPRPRTGGVMPLVTTSASLLWRPSLYGSAVCRDGPTAEVTPFIQLVATAEHLAAMVIPAARLAAILLQIARGLPPA